MPQLDDVHIVLDESYPEKQGVEKTRSSSFQLQFAVDAGDELIWLDGVMFRSVVDTRLSNSLPCRTQLCRVAEARLHVHPCRTFKSLAAEALRMVGELIVNAHGNQLANEFRTPQTPLSVLEDKNENGLPCDGYLYRDKGLHYSRL